MMLTTRDQARGSGRSCPDSGESEAAILHAWLKELEDVNARYRALLPDLGRVSLSQAERLRLSGSGQQRYGYIDVVSDMSSAYPQFWPAYGKGNETERIKAMIRNIEVLRNLQAFFEIGTRLTRDMLLLVGDKSYRLANNYYNSVREAARGQVRDSETVWKLLRAYWKRKPKAKLTQEEVIRDAKAVIHGTKDGKVCVSHTSDPVVPGEKTLIDTAHPPQHAHAENETNEEAAGSSEPWEWEGNRE